MVACEDAIFSGREIGVNNVIDPSVELGTQGCPAFSIRKSKVFIRLGGHNVDPRDVAHHKFCFGDSLLRCGEPCLTARLW